MSYSDNHPFSMAQGMNMGQGNQGRPQVQGQGGKMDINSLLQAWFSGGNMSQLGGQMGQPQQQGQQIAQPMGQPLGNGMLGQQPQQNQIYERNFFQPQSRYGLLGK